MRLCQFSNLWFAGQAENWDLAGFYLNEARNHIDWTIRLYPIRTTSHGPLDLRPVFETIKSSSFAEIRDALDAHDEAGFEQAYRHALDERHSRHVAAEKPYLDPHIPDAPASKMISMTPMER